MAHLLRISPPALDFGDVAPGRAYDRVLRLRNTGDKSLSLRLTMEGSQGSPESDSVRKCFTFQPSSLVLPAGGSAQVAVGLKSGPADGQTSTKKSQLLIRVGSAGSTTSSGPGPKDHHLGIVKVELLTGNSNGPGTRASSTSVTGKPKASTTVRLSSTLQRAKSLSSSPGGKNLKPSIKGGNTKGANSISRSPLRKSPQVQDRPTAAFPQLFSRSRVINVKAQPAPGSSETVTSSPAKLPQPGEDAIDDDIDDDDLVVTPSEAGAAAPSLLLSTARSRNTSSRTPRAPSNTPVKFKGGRRLGPGQSPGPPSPATPSFARANFYSGGSEQPQVQVNQHEEGLQADNVNESNNAVPAEPAATTVTGTSETAAAPEPAIAAAGKSPRFEGNRNDDPAPESAVQPGPSSGAALNGNTNLAVTQTVTDIVIAPTDPPAAPVGPVTNSISTVTVPPTHSRFSAHPRNLAANRGKLARASPRFAEEIERECRESQTARSREVTVSPTKGLAPNPAPAPVTVTPDGDSVNQPQPQSSCSVSESLQHQAALAQLDLQYKGQILDLQTEISSLQCWRGYSLAVDEKLTQNFQLFGSMDPVVRERNWQDFVKLRDDALKTEQEAQNAKVLKILEWKDGVIRTNAEREQKKQQEIQGERENMGRERRGFQARIEDLERKLAVSGQRQTAMLSDLKEIEDVREHELTLHQRRIQGLSKELESSRKTVLEVKQREEEAVKEAERRTKAFQESQQALEGVRKALRNKQKEVASGELENLRRDLGEEKGEVERLSKLNAEAAGEIQRLVAEVNEREKGQKEGEEGEEGVQGKSSVPCLLNENAFLKREVERLEAELRGAVEELSDQESLMNQARSKLLSETLSDQPLWDARKQCTALQQQIESLKREKEIELLPRIRELNEEMDREKEAKKVRIQGLEDELLSLGKGKSFCSGGTQTVDGQAWSQLEVEKTLFSNSGPLRSLGDQLRLEVSRSEAALHAGELDWSQQKTGFENRIVDLERDLKLKTSEVIEFKRLFKEKREECEEAKRDKGREILEEKNRVAALESELAAKIEGIQQRETSFKEEAEAWEAERRRFEGKLKERHLQLVEALGSLERAGKDNPQFRDKRLSELTAHSLAAIRKESAGQLQISQLKHSVSALTTKLSGAERNSKLLSEKLLVAESRAETQKKQLQDLGTAGEDEKDVRCKLEEEVRVLKRELGFSEDMGRELERDLERTRKEGREEGERYRNLMREERTRLEGSNDSATLTAPSGQPHESADPAVLLVDGNILNNNYGNSTVNNFEVQASTQPGPSNLDSVSASPSESCASVSDIGLPLDSGASNSDFTFDDSLLLLQGGGPGPGPGPASSSHYGLSGSVGANSYAENVNQNARSKSSSTGNRGGPSLRPPTVPSSGYGPGGSYLVANGTHHTGANNNYSRSRSATGGKTGPSARTRGSGSARNANLNRGPGPGLTTSRRNGSGQTGPLSLANLTLPGPNLNLSGNQPQTQLLSMTQNQLLPTNLKISHRLSSFLNDVLQNFKTALLPHRDDAEVLKQLGEAHMGLIRKLFSCEHSLVWAEFRGERAKRELDRVVERYGVKGAGQDTKALPSVTNSTETAPESQSESYLKAISALESSLKQKSQLFDHLNIRCGELESRNHELESLYGWSQQELTKASSHLKLAEGKFKSELIRVKASSEKVVLARIEGWREKILEKALTVPTGSAGGGGGATGSATKSAPLPSISLTSFHTAAPGGVSQTNSHGSNHNQADVTVTIEEVVTPLDEAGGGGILDNDSMGMEVEGVSGVLDDGLNQKHAGISNSSDSESTQARIWSLELTVEELSAALADAQKQAVAAFEENCQLKTHIESVVGGVANEYDALPAPETVAEISETQVPKTVTLPTVPQPIPQPSLVPANQDVLTLELPEHALNIDGVTLASLANGSAGTGTNVPTVYESESVKLMERQPELKIPPLSSSTVKVPQPLSPLSQFNTRGTKASRPSSSPFSTAINFPNLSSRPLFRSSKLTLSPSAFSNSPLIATKSRSNFEHFFSTPLRCSLRFTYLPCNCFCASNNADMRFISSRCCFSAKLSISKAVSCRHSSSCFSICFWKSCWRFFSSSVVIRS